MAGTSHTELSAAAALTAYSLSWLKEEQKKKKKSRGLRVAVNFKSAVQGDSARGVECHGSRLNVSRVNSRPSACGVLVGRSFENFVSPLSVRVFVKRVTRCRVLQHQFSTHGADISSQDFKPCQLIHCVWTRHVLT